MASGIPLPGATYEELTHARETVLKALKAQPVETSELDLKKTAAEALRPFQEQLRIRADQQMRNRVASCGHLMWGLSTEDAKRTAEDIRQALGKLPSFTPQPELERVRNKILERARARQERQRQKAQLIETALNSEIHPYMVRLQNQGYQFSEPTFAASQKLREPIREELEETLNGGEDIEVVKARVRRLAKNLTVVLR